MNILIRCMAMNFISGSPLYNYELARELAKSHSVTIASVWDPVLGDALELRHNLELAGVKCVEQAKGKFDLTLVSQGKDYKKTSPTINVVHSEYECEAPMMDADAWIAIRPSIKEHLIKLGLPAADISVIYNGVDTQRFNPSVRKQYYKDKPYRVSLVPCTFDGLRAKFIEYMASLATADHHVIFMGYGHGATVPTGEYIEVLPDTFNIEQYMANADAVHGILLGRVNLEAKMMNMPSFYYDPETMNKFMFQGGYERKYDIIEVAKDILKLAATI